MNSRLFLYSSLFFVLILIFDAWDSSKNPSIVSVNSQQEMPSTSDEKITTNQEQPRPSVTIKEKNVIESTYITATTDTLKVVIDLADGSIVSADLLNYSEFFGNNDDKVRLLNNELETYVARVGLQNKNNEVPVNFTTDKTEHNLGNNDALKIVLKSTAQNGIRIIKSYDFTRGSHLIRVTQSVFNESGTTSEWRQFNTLERGEETSGNSMLYTYTGAAYFNEADKFNKIEFDEIKEDDFLKKSNSGWISMIQHYFLTAWIPQPSTDSRQTIYTRNFVDQTTDKYLIGTVGNYKSINSGAHVDFNTSLYVGPKKQDEIEDIAPGLILTVDYGFLTFLAAPLFWVLDKIHYFIGNWGWSIILLTLLIKIVFFKLSETSYKSMAKMKKLTPRMQALKERFGDDRKKFSEALMKIYKEEKVNPLGGCLPILIQIPVFIALYWVLIESVEMRHAPFFGWVQDLSSADPYYILPIAMGITMYIQQKLNPTPTDEMQQKIFMALPFVFTFLFATFPSGLVLYWLTNNVLSIAQQYVINKRVNES